MATDQPAPEMGEDDDAPTPEMGADKDTASRAKADADDPRDAEMARMRDALKKANNEAARLRKKEEERADAELGEVDRLKKVARERDERASALQSDLRRTRLEHRAEVTAIQLGFRDPDDALKLADLSDVEFDEADRPDAKGVKAALERLAKAKPHLVGAEEKSRAGTPIRDHRPVAGGPQGGGRPALTGVDREAAAMRSTGRYSI